MPVSIFIQTLNEEQNLPSCLDSVSWCDDVVVLRTSDDGIGFDARAVVRRDREGSHYGLSSLAERCALVGASLRIDSVPGHGTTVIVELPVAPVPERAD